MKSKTKRRSLLTLLAGLPIIAQAFIWIVVTVGVLIFGGWATWKIYQWAQMVNAPKSPPPSPQTNNVLRIYSTGTNAGIGSLGNSVCVYDNSSMGPAPSIGTQPLDQSSTQAYTFQYGSLGSSFRPWMTNGANASPITVLSSNTCILSSAGYQIEMTYNQDGTVTANQVGSDSNLYTVVIEETHDLRNWTPVLTNDSCLNGDIQNFSYTNDWTPIHFYRVRQ